MDAAITATTDFSSTTEMENKLFKQLPASIFRSFQFLFFFAGCFTNAPDYEAYSVLHYYFYIFSYYVIMYIFFTMSIL